MFSSITKEAHSCKAPFWCATSYMMLKFSPCFIQAFHNLLLIQEASGNRLVSSCCCGTKRPLWIWSKIRVKKPFLLRMLNSKRNMSQTRGARKGVQCPKRALLLIFAETGVGPLTFAVTGCLTVCLLASAATFLRKCLHLHWKIPVSAPTDNLCIGAWGENFQFPVSCCKG